MRKLFLILGVALALVGLAPPIEAQATNTRPSIAVVYDFKARTVTPATIVGEQRIASNLFGSKDVTLDAMAFVGVTTGSNRPTKGTLGAAIAIQARLGDDRIRGILGVAGRVEAGRPIATGLLFGISYRFVGLPGP